MKKIIALVLCLVMVFALCACGESNTATTAPAADTATEAPAEEPAAAGSVYYLNFKPEADEAWQALAETYTKQTGVPVTVVTAASGTYDQTLTSEMDKSEAPTMFQVGNPGAVATWGEYCLDLTGTDVYNEMTTHAFDQVGDDGFTYSIGYCYECYGIIVNKALLEQAGHSIDEIKDFESLKAVADDIHARAGELGFDAFSSAGLDSSSSWRFSGHLANMPLYYELRDDGITAQPETIKGTYLDNFKMIWDLYTADSATTGADLLTSTGDASEAEFGEGKAVFFQNGSWEYNNLVGDGKFSDDDVTMIPIYIGAGDEANQGLCTGTENFWCVNKEAPEEDIQATLDFIYWCVSSDEGTKAMADMGFVIPFKNAQESQNVFVKADSELTAAGKTPVSWNFTTMPSEEWKNGVGSALTAYAAGTSDWNAVVSAFVDGWASEAALNAAG